MSRRSGFLALGILILVLFSTFSLGTDAKVVLVTGFEPFGTHDINPSQLIAETLNGSIISNASVIGIVLPVNFSTSVEKAKEAIALFHPDVVISLGLNAKATGVEIEKIGVNMKRYPLENGRWSFPRRIDSKGPFLRITSLKTSGIVRKIHEADIPVKQSYFAGSYICNALFYEVLGYVKDQNLPISVGFLHMPLLDSQDPGGLPLGMMVNATKIAIQESLG
jgi:pyroglutamyl-peptidase